MQAATLHSEATQANSPVATARLAQSAERKALNLVVVGSSPTVGAFLLLDLGGRLQPAVLLQCGAEAIRRFVLDRIRYSLAG